MSGISIVSYSSVTRCVFDRKLRMSWNRIIQNNNVVETKLTPFTRTMAQQRSCSADTSRTQGTVSRTLNNAINKFRVDSEIGVSTETQFREMRVYAGEHVVSRWLSNLIGYFATARPVGLPNSGFLWEMPTMLNRGSAPHQIEAVISTLVKLWCGWQEIWIASSKDRRRKHLWRQRFHQNSR